VKTQIGGAMAQASNEHEYFSNDKPGATATIETCHTCGSVEGNEVGGDRVKPHRCRPQLIKVDLPKHVQLHVIWKRHASATQKESWLVSAMLGVAFALLKWRHMADLERPEKRPASAQ
jgi:hypothetical protein